MNIFNKRPLCLWCAAFLLGCAVFFYTGIRVKIIAAFIFTTIPLILLIISKLVHYLNKRIKTCIKTAAVISFAAVTALVLCFFCFNLHAEKYISLKGETHTVTAYCTEKVYDGSYSSVSVIRITSIDGESTDFSALLNTDFSSGLSLYENFKTKLNFCELEDDSGTFPQKLYYNSRGIFISAENTEDNLKTFGKEENLSFYMQKAKGFCSRRLRKCLDPDVYGLAAGILLGDRSEIDSTLERDFRTLGISHLIAVSGFNLAVLIGILCLILKKLKTPLLPECLTEAVLILFYMGLCGFSASIVRSGIMLLIFVLSKLAGEKNDGITSLFTAVTLICLFTPSAIFDVSLLLSFLATFGLLTFGKDADKILNEKKLKPVFKYLLSSVVVTASALLFTLPVMWLYFGSVSAAAIPANIIFAPLISLVMYITPFLVIFPDIPFLSGLAAHAVDRICSLVIYLSSWAKYFRNLVVSLNFGFVKYLVLLLVISIAAVLIIKINKAFIKAVPYLMFLLIFTLCFVNVTGDKAELIYSSYKNNEYILLASERKTALIDMSAGYSSITYSASGSAGKELCKVNIDAYVLTHLHKRHIASFVYLCTHFYMDYLILPEPVSESDQGIYQSLTTLAQDYKCKIITYSHDQTEGSVSFFGTEIDFMEYTAIKRSTHPVLSFEISKGNYSLMYLGGSVFDSDRDFLKNASDADALIFGIHGPVIKNKVAESRVDFCENSLHVFASKEVMSSYGSNSDKMNVLSDDGKNFVHIIIP